MSKKLFKENILITGTDSGNRANKVSYIDLNGNVQSFTIPTIVAPGPATRVDDIQSSEIGNRGAADVPGESTLHLKIESSSLTKENQTSYWFVGEFAQNRKGKLEPKGTDEQKYNNEKHIITTLAGIAVAAFKTKKTKVTAPYSGGLPMAEYKKFGNQVIDAITGTHIVEAISGAFAGMRVEIEITDGLVQVEGMASTLALSFDVKKGELVTTKNVDQLENDFAAGDLGAGTNDYALFINGKIDDSLTFNTNNGTNTVIDQMMEAVRKAEVFADYRERLERANPNDLVQPYPTRESFIRQVIEPEIKKLIEDDKHELEFTCSWGPKRNKDVTDIILPLLNEHGQKVLDEVYLFWGKANVDHLAVVGGGLLLAWNTFRQVKDEFIFPENILEAPYYTSKSYLIASYGNELEKLTAGATK
jgi:plasmid segregation protein ParM